MRGKVELTYNISDAVQTLIDVSQDISHFEDWTEQIVHWVIITVLNVRLVYARREIAPVKVREKQHISNLNHYYYYYYYLGYLNFLSFKRGTILIKFRAVNKFRAVDEHFN